MAEFKQEKLDVKDLVVGMYVARLDRPWVGTPFPIQGFQIKSFEEIRTLGIYCRHVFVDSLKSKINVEKHLKSTQNNSGRQSFINLKVNEEKYEKTKALGQEIRNAGSLHDDIAHAVDEVMNKLIAGKPVALPATRRIATKMVDSVINNPDAFAWIARIRDKDNYTYSHSVRSSVWAITFGRHLGLARNKLENLAQGVLMSEVGKTKLPLDLLTKRDRLTDEEFELLKKHVGYGVEILKSTKGINEDILYVVSTIHERHDGTGYPNGLRGDQIPLLGKVAGIVDFYDSVTCPRYDEKALSSADAMTKLHNIKNEEFQGELVEEFIQAIGIYPTGTLVELRTGEVGVIVEQNFERRLRPKIMLILDRDKQPLRKHIEIDLLTELETKKGEKLDISKSLPEGAYGIDLAAFRKNFISRMLGLGNTLFRH
jgi:HD-GYP domain-containing protein (c-di-GMP phosphodiesterase class II)